MRHAFGPGEVLRKELDGYAVENKVGGFASKLPAMVDDVCEHLRKDDIGQIEGRIE